MSFACTTGSVYVFLGLVGGYGGAAAWMTLVDIAFIRRGFCFFVVAVYSVRVYLSSYRADCAGYVFTTELDSCSTGTYEGWDR